MAILFGCGGGCVPRLLRDDGSGLPVLLLALVGDSNYLQRLGNQLRALRRDDPVAGVLIWTKPQVRVYSFVVAGLLVAGIGVSLLVLAEVLGDAGGCGSGWLGRCCCRW